MNTKQAKGAHAKMDLIAGRIQAIKTQIFSDPAKVNLFDIAARIKGAKAELEYIDAAMSSNPDDMLASLNKEMESLSDELASVEEVLKPPKPPVEEEEE